MSDEEVRPELIEGEQAAFTSLEADTANLKLSAVATAKVTELNADMSAIGAVSGVDKARATRSAVGVLASNTETELMQGYASMVLSAGDVEITQAGAQLVVAAGDIEMSQGGALIAAGKSVSIKEGWVGIIASPDAQIAEGVKVAFGPREAVIFGAVFGAICGAVFALIVGSQYRCESEGM